MKPEFIIGMVVITVLFSVSLLSMHTIMARGVFCNEGEKLPCGSNIGACKFGVQTCIGGFFSACEGGVKPSFENCDRLDNDCDGVADNECTFFEQAEESAISSGRVPHEAQARFTCGNDICERRGGFLLMEGEPTIVVVNTEPHTFTLEKVIDWRSVKICVDSKCLATNTGLSPAFGKFSVLIGGVHEGREGFSKGSVSLVVGEDPNTCSADCKRREVCGNAVCEFKETASSCRFDCRDEFCGDNYCNMKGFSLLKDRPVIVKVNNDFHVVELVETLEKDGRAYATVEIDDISNVVIRENEMRSAGGVSIYASDINRAGTSIIVGENRVTCPQDCSGFFLFQSVSCGNSICEEKKFSMREKELKSVSVNGQFHTIEVFFINPDGATQVQVDELPLELISPGTPERIGGINIEVANAFVASRPGSSSFVQLNLHEDSDTCSSDC